MQENIPINLEKKPEVRIEFKLPLGGLRKFKIPLEENSFMNLDQALYKVINTNKLSGSHIKINGTDASLTDYRSLNPGDIITVEYNYPDSGKEEKIPDFKIEPIKE
jgi:flagellar basal body L-ring protein FlgH